MCGLSAIPGGQSLSLACPRESNQREGHPRGRGRRASCPATPQAGCGGSLTVRPCTGSERARILRAPLRAFSFAPLPRPRGTREKQSAAVPAAEAALLLILGPSVTRRRADGQGPRTARVRATDRAHSAAGQDALSAEPRPPVAHRRFSAGAAPRVCSLWLLSLAQARESNAPARMAGKTHRDVSRFSRQRKIRTKAGFRPSPE